MIRLLILLIIFITNNSYADLNDTATSTNILPNANVTSSNYDNVDLDGVSTTNGSLTNNSSINGFTVTCNTLVNNNCGKSWNGEIEGSHDITVSTSGTLVGISGVDESGNTYTSTQKKLDGGIQLESTISVQNCEWANSQWACGQSSGSVDSFTTTVIIKDANGTELAKVNQIRTDDAGYNANAKQFSDTVVHNGTGANSYDWSWSAIDGSGSTTSQTLGSNLLGAELILQFPTDDYEPLTTTEIEEINNQLNTINLNENEIWDVISEIESQIETEIYELTATPVSVSLEESFQISIYEPQQQIEESVIEEIITFIEEEKIETIKEEVTTKIEEKIETKKQEIKEEKIKEETKEEKKVVKQKSLEGEETKKEEKNNLSSQNKEEENKEEEIVTENKEEEKEKEIKVVSKTEEKKEISEKIEINITDNVKVNIQEIKLFDNPNSLNEYQTASLYESRDLYNDNRTDIFFKSDLTLYAKDVYVTLSFDNYINIDPLNVRDKKLYDLNATKIKLMLELKNLKR